MDMRRVSAEGAIHFIGVGGSSMSGLAIMLHRLGFRVSGSDREDSANLQIVHAAGVHVTVGHHAANIGEDVRTVVTTAGIGPDNPEVMGAIERGIGIVDRADILARIMDRYPVGIAVAGTHGKTTTTSLTVEALTAAGVNPGASLGAKATVDGGNYRMGGGDHFVAEACEYHRHFLRLNPQIAVVLNVEAEHSDYFDGIDDIVAAFQDFAQRVRPGGVLITSADCPRARALTVGEDRTHMTFGEAADADYRAEALTWHLGRPRFTVTYRGGQLGELAPRLLGRHNVGNVLAAVAAGHQAGLTLDQMRPGLEAFGGAPRRVEYKGSRDGVRVFDDIACHPNEIAATMEAIRGAAPGGRSLVVLRPNSFTRVRDFMHQYADCFTPQETVVVTDIYQARDTETFGLSSLDLVLAMRSSGRDVHYTKEPGTIKRLASASLRSGDVLVTIGPGDIGSLGEAWLSTET
ncbi:UDP-N-acetylmuramate--L-alanine ligase [Streptomyces sp. NPDC002643]